MKSKPRGKPRAFKHQSVPSAHIWGKRAVYIEGRYGQSSAMFNAHECRKLAAWLLKAATWLEAQQKTGGKNAK